LVGGLVHHLCLEPVQVQALGINAGLADDEARLIEQVGRIVADRSLHFKRISSYGTAQVLQMQQAIGIADLDVDSLAFGLQAQGLKGRIPHLEGALSAPVGSRMAQGVG
jgi:hypothetical protein